MKVIYEDGRFVIVHETEFEEDFLEEFFANSTKDQKYQMHRKTGISRSEFHGIEIVKSMPMDIGIQPRKFDFDKIKDINPFITDQRVYPLTDHQKEYSEMMDAILRPNDSETGIQFNDLKDCEFDENGQPFKKPHVRGGFANQNIDTFLDC